MLLTLLAATGFALLRIRNLFAVVMLAGIYSLLSAGLFTVMDAVDVAFTEAAVGAGISTVLFLGALALGGHHENKPGHTPLLPLFVVCLTGAALVYGTMDMPGFGGALNPVHHHVADHYLEESYGEIGIPNVVTSVLASYRGYDTMGETTVVFAAAVGVMILLVGGRRVRRAGGGGRAMREEVIVRVGAKVLAPFIIMFALYIHFHGDYSPGGGFQAGVILAAVFALLALVYGLEEVQRVLPSWFVRGCAALGVLIFAGVGVVTMVLGHNYLAYNALAPDPTHPEHGQHYGILLVELGVLVTVFGVMVTVFYLIAGRGKEDS